MFYTLTVCHTFPPLLSLPLKVVSVNRAFIEICSQFHMVRAILPEQNTVCLMAACLCCSYEDTEVKRTR